ncbi:MAG TPA: threonine/serine exporter family protein [Candidatus Saccharimonadaceae bacterium]|nr:threonine/serine exporter family protein [Candidatus Saccharimonadaceae bacterium]
MRFWPRFRKFSQPGVADMRSVFSPIEKFGETLTPNMRALRLTMTASDLLLSMGVPANSVVGKALDITETYCKRPVHIDINANLLMLSQLRGTDKEPLTMFRPVPARAINYMTVQAVQHLIYEIHEGKHTLEQAELILEEILKQKHRYPWWVVMLGNGGIVAGVALMFSTSWRVIMVTFVIGLLTDRLLAYFTRHDVPSFFRQVGAAAFITILAALINLLASHHVNFFHGMNPTLMVVGGIVMLVAGLVIVGAIQDAIEEYYLTATSRILKVGMLTVGIIVGILIALYTARKLGFGIAVSPNPLHLTAIHFQVAGGAIAAAAYAMNTQTRIRAIIWAGILGGAALAIMYGAAHIDVSIVPASGLAAVVVGLIATLFSRLWRTPSVGIVACAIVPLVPGLALYTAMMQLVNYPAGSPLFFMGIGSLFTAISTALAIAAGASFGSLLGRPLHQNLAHNRNLQPFVDFMRRQIKVDRRYRLAGFVLHQPDDDMNTK